MRIIQPSPDRLICESRQDLGELFRNCAITMSSLMIFCLASIIVSVVSKSSQSIEIIEWFAGAVLFSFGMLSLLIFDYIVTFDLRNGNIRVFRYWPLLRKSTQRDYSLSFITGISIKPAPRSANFYGIWVERNNYEEILLAPAYTQDTAVVEADAHKIEQILGLV